ncbi:MAG: DUF1272 domain-containing protein [Rhodanobacteraceae bacterium]|jgi:hypothetical protein
MALQMRGECEHCHAQVTPDGEAWICVFECTFCPRCADSMQHVCPNCGGELVHRPRPNPARAAGQATA